MTTHSSILAWRIPMDREAWQARRGCTGLDTTEATKQQKQQHLHCTDKTIKA